MPGSGGAADRHGGRRVPGGWLVRLVVVGVAGFWAATTAAAATEPGYAWTGDYLSELAARDATHAWWAVLGFLASAAAHAVGAYALLRRRVGNSAPASRTAGVALAVAALAVVGIAGFRLSGSGPGDVLDSLHAGSVVVYQLALVVAMTTAVAGRRTPGTLVAAVSTVLLVVSLLPAADVLGGAGVAQRVWVATDQLWLLVVTALAVRTTRR